MPDVQTIFVDGELETDSNIYNSTCSLDSLPTKLVLQWIIVDYVYYRICLKGYKNIELFERERGHTVKDRLLDLIMRHLVRRAEEVEAKFTPRFKNRNALLLCAPERALIDFADSLNNIWADGLANWGRFLSYITFTAAYCMSCLDAGMVLIIRTLVEHAVQDLDAKMGKWALAHGGWRGFLTALQEVKLN
ncbi:Bcl-2 protein 1 [Fasciolopsis buskii]|uniref:Bcl-2 protein 1 n=1 Tax=Fasciolopsis buskii TaxID=27845 RepID=A0A8E0RQ12_9TREM|nr:Bcl-2 protein 1 [Fasciolopsis buski]